MGSRTSGGGRPAVILKACTEFASLHWTDAAGQSIDVHWPQSAGWSDHEMTRFATAVHVLGAARAGRG